MGLIVTDVERLKAKVRKMAAGRVLAGGVADVGLDLAAMAGCRACLVAGYGSLSAAPRTHSRDRLIWILDGQVDVYDTGGNVNYVRQGESAVLAGGSAYRLVFPQLTIYLLVQVED